MIKISYHQRKVLPKNFWKTFWPNSFFGFHFLLHLIILLLELWLNNHWQYDTPACQNKLVKISLILQAYKLTLWIRKNLTIALFITFTTSTNPSSISNQIGKEEKVDFTCISLSAKSLDSCSKESIFCLNKEFSVLNR